MASYGNRTAAVKDSTAWGTYGHTFSSVWAIAVLNKNSRLDVLGKNPADYLPGSSKFFSTLLWVCTAFAFGKYHASAKEGETHR